jgi:hypothetical protein
MCAVLGCPVLGLLLYFWFCKWVSNLKTIQMGRWNISSFVRRFELLSRRTTSEQSIKSAPLAALAFYFKIQRGSDYQTSLVFELSILGKPGHLFTETIWILTDLVNYTQSHHFVWQAKGHAGKFSGNGMIVPFDYHNSICPVSNVSGIWIPGFSYPNCILRHIKCLGLALRWQN